MITTSTFCTRCVWPGIHPHTGLQRPITFDPDAAAGRDDIVLAHLNHRLVQRCLRLLRAEVWAPPPSESTSEVAAPLWLCPRCGGPMVLLERLTSAQARLRSPPTGAQSCP